MQNEFIRYCVQLDKITKYLKKKQFLTLKWIPVKTGSINQ